jgi:hypothetical protein
MAVNMPGNRPSKTNYYIPLRYLRAWTALFFALALLIAAVTGLLVALGY